MVSIPRPAELLGEWIPDRFLPDHQFTQFELSGVSPRAGEGYRTPVATLVRRGPAHHSTAMLYLHGWNDYYFQPHLAGFMADQGVDLYALDLHRYGRSLLPGQIAGYADDLDEYREELDHAAELILADHDQLILMAHSTGGLIGSLWAGQRPGLLHLMVLNAPWLAMAGAPLEWELRRPVVEALGRLDPLRPVRQRDSHFYGQSIRADQEGEWSFNARLKSSPRFVPRFGWLRAVLAGQDRVHRGLGIDVPVLVITSQRSLVPRAWSDELRSVDTVLDVDRIMATAPGLGGQVHLLRVPGALHDVLLSAPAVREGALRAIGDWVGGRLPRLDA